MNHPYKFVSSMAKQVSVAKKTQKRLMSKPKTLTKSKTSVSEVVGFFYMRHNINPTRLARHTSLLGKLTKLFNASQCISVCCNNSFEKGKIIECIKMYWFSVDVLYLGDDDGIARNKQKSPPLPVPKIYCQVLNVSFPEKTSTRHHCRIGENLVGLLRERFDFSYCIIFTHNTAAVTNLRNVVHIEKI